MSVVSVSERVAGVDEAGRGPLAGPVVAGAVVLPATASIEGLADSKRLSARTRVRLYEAIIDCADSWSVAWCDPAEIDGINILQATMLAMRRALMGLSVWPQRVLIDGNRLPDLDFFGARMNGDAIVGGDASVPMISAASILAKVTRDRIMRQYDAVFPHYGFAQHKGYATKRHLRALEDMGPCIQHRQSFRPVREWAATSSADSSGARMDAARNPHPVRVTISP